MSTQPCHNLRTPSLSQGKGKKLHGEFQQICRLTKGNLIKAAPVQKVFSHTRRVSTGYHRAFPNLQRDGKVGQGAPYQNPEQL